MADLKRHIYKGFIKRKRHTKQGFIYLSEWKLSKRYMKWSLKNLKKMKADANGSVHSR